MRPTKCAWAVVLSCIVAPLTFGGCGYGFVGEHSALPEDVRSVGVGRIENASREVGLEKELQFALERELRVRRQFRVEQDAAEADAVLTGTIKSVRFRPVAFGDQDRAVQYQVSMFLDVALTRQRDGEVLWRVKGLREVDEYSTAAKVIVTSSSQFQQGTLDAANLNNPEFSNIQVGETERRAAFARLLTMSARDIYNQMAERF